VVSLFPCWSETFILREILALLEQGVDVRIFSLKHPHENLVHPDAERLLDRVIYPPPFAQTLASVIRTTLVSPWVVARQLFMIGRSLSRHPAALAKSWVTCWRTLGALSPIRAWRAQAIHAHWATYPSTAAFILSSHLKVPFSFTAHAHDIFLEDHLLREKFNAAAFVVTISEYNRRYLGERFGPSVHDKIRIIHCGVDIRDFPPTPGPRERAALLFVGRFDEIKGLPVLLHACRVLQEQGVVFHCDIIGDGAARLRLEQLCGSLGLQDTVVFLGARPQHEVRRRLQQATVFVMPSVVAPDGNRDGIPVALMEAMAAYTPVVSTTVSGIPELVVDGESGLLVPPGDAAALAQAMRRLLEDAAYAQRLAAGGRAVVEQYFEANREAARLYGLIEGTFGA
jgi:glycosyltransferase involved in cell wall biosynthesis